MNDPTNLKRRDVVRTLTAGLGAATLTGGASAATPNAAGARAMPLTDPKTLYSKPPFKGQSQAWPGLARDMDPKPDHGEKSYRGSGRLAGRRALITGGDSGMGRAAAIAYAREGADVAINYYPTEEPDALEVIALIEAEGRKAVALPGDLRSESFCQSLVADAVRRLGGLDIVVSNAGRQQAHDSILDISSEDFDATMKTNIYAPFWILKAAVPHLPPGATIIASTSEQATDPTPDLYDYAMTKAATTNFVRSLAKQLVAKGIRVNGVAPGPIWTPLQVSGEAGASAARREPGEAEELRRQDADGPTRSAGRARVDLRAARGGRRELRDGSGRTREQIRAPHDGADRIVGLRVALVVVDRFEDRGRQSPLREQGAADLRMVEAEVAVLVPEARDSRERRGGRLAVLFGQHAAEGSPRLACGTRADRPPAAATCTARATRVARSSRRGAVARSSLRRCR